MKIKTKKIYELIKSFCIIIVLCEEAVRVLTNDNRIIVYIAMVLLFLFYGKNILESINYFINKYLTIFVSFNSLILYILFTNLISFSFDIQIIKILIYVFLAFIFSRISQEKIHKTISTIIYIMPFFSIYIFINFAQLISVYGGLGKLNYLNITSATSFVTSVSLAKLLSSDCFIEKIILSICIFIHFITLMSYMSAGNFIAPILTFILLLFIKSLKENKLYRFIIVLLPIFLLISYINTYLSQNNDILFSKIVKYIENASETSRGILWKGYIGSITKNEQWLTGIGFKAKGYPHNFVLEIVGENGLIGLLFIVSVIGSFVFKIYKMKFNPYSCLITAGLLHYTILYSKSYSIYDGYLLFIFLILFLGLGPRDEFESERSLLEVNKNSIIKRINLIKFNDYSN